MAKKGRRKIIVNRETFYYRVKAWYVVIHRPETGEYETRNKCPKSTIRPADVENMIRSRWFYQMELRVAHEFMGGEL